MVAPSWDMFQSNAQMKQGQSQQQPNQQQPITQDEEKPEGEKPQWGNFQSPETYQGEPDPTEDESGLGYFVRNISANASRIPSREVGCVDSSRLSPEPLIEC